MSQRAGAQSGRAAQFYEFSNPAPSEYDPENETDFGDAIIIPEQDIDYGALELTNKGEEKGASLRRVNDSALISSSHGKYAGKRASRGDIDQLGRVADGDSDGEGGDGDDSDDQGTEGGIWSAKETTALVDSLSSASEISDNNADEDALDEQSDQDFNDQHDQGSENGANMISNERQHVKKPTKEVKGEGREPHEEGLDGTGVTTAQDSDMKKAQHTRNQLQVWDDVMAIRVLLQPVVTQAIRLPQLDDFVSFTKVDNTLGVEFKETAEDLALLMDDLVGLQTQCLAHSASQARKRPRESEDSSASPSSSQSVPAGLPRLAERWDTIHHLNTSLNTYCGTVLDKWSGKMQVSSGKIFSKKFQSINQGFMNQIESLFTDRERLVKRTTHMRKELPIFGKENQQEFDDEIYDDTDFYQSLLKELIANGSVGYGKSTETTDVKRAKTKQHKDYLKNASKGRLINYDVQEKLVHFMPPDDRPIMCDWNLDELFVNLFGQSHQLKISPLSGP